MSGREHDAVREARDALVIIGTATPVVAAIALLVGVATGSTSGLLRWVVGTLVVAVVLLVCVASALLVADRVGRRWWNVRPYPVRRVQLVPASLGVGLLLIAGLPTTQPILIGFAAVALVLGLLVAAGAAFDL
ncbi:MAG: hypothetical protein QOJ31_1301 [Gaiellales bacterium]|nr:hypothetical protein [Gaiellales bacterium]MDX6546332.1 hypothetical protein [Gaiellales bacterium]MDX6550617.1 hypothetical protein [Gaiellales bacterium]